jgi:hypothetical protein
VLVPIAMLGFGVGLVTLGRWLARDEERKLREFLARELESAESTGATPIE